jgi:phenylalanyl-tRNA synthetase beta chain
VLQLGPKARIAEIGEVHPRILKALDVDGPMLAFELILDRLPEPKKKAVRTRPAFRPSPLMPLTRDFAFVVDRDRPAGDLVRAVASVEKQLVEDVSVFDVYEGPGVPEGKKSVALEVRIQPREKTLTDAEIEALSARLIAAAEKTVGAKLRS